LIQLDEPQTDWHIALAWRRQAHLPPAARAWLDLALEMGNVPGTRPSLGLSASDDS
jgi:DNA-binding transcriptional LysR family regulator